MAKINTIFRVFVLMVISYVSFPLYADMLIVPKAMQASTIAEIFIGESHIRVELEIGFKDLKAFNKLLPAEIYNKLYPQAIPFKQRLQQFFSEDFVFLADKKKLPGVLSHFEIKNRLKRDDISGEPIPSKDKNSERVAFVVLDYFYKGKPTSVSISPPRSKQGIVKANIGFITYHHGVAISDFRYLSFKENITLDWDDPWYSQFQNRNIVRRYNFPISAFLYIEPFEVRKEIVIRLQDLQKHWIDLGLANKKIITPKEQVDIKKKVAAFLMARNSVSIDGKKIKPVLGRIHFINRSLKKTSIVDSTQNLSITTATLGVIFVYPIVGLPENVSMQWDMFSPSIQIISSQAVDETGGVPYKLTPENNTLVWQNFLQNPTNISLVNLKSPSEVRVLEQESNAIVLGLLKNIYHAFDYHTESDTYDVLAKSTTHDLLTKLYLETRKSLAIKNQGGAKVKIKKVTLIANKVEPLEDGVGFKAHCTWNTTGSVGHWGHIHQRKNQYQAVITVKAINDTWKITDIEMLNEFRL